MKSSRYSVVSRRRFVAGSVATGLALLFPGVVGAATKKKKTTTTTVKKKVTTTTKVAGTATAATGGAAFPAGHEVAINFTFAASDGFRVKNPYVAVWIEDSGGLLLRTVALFYKEREAKYLRDLSRWYRGYSDWVATGGPDNAVSVSGATRLPGEYAVAWDGKDGQGKTVAQGMYWICIEAARERGPYELIREQITVGSKMSTTTLAPSGELTAASVELRAS